MCTLHLSYDLAQVYVLFLCCLPLHQSHTPILSNPEFLVCYPPSGILTTSLLLPGLQFFLVSFRTFLSSVSLLEENGPDIHLWPLKTSFLFLGFSSGLDLHLYLVQILLLDCCLPCMCGSSTVASYNVLPSFPVCCGLTEPFSLLQYQESSPWEAISVLLSQARVLPLLSIKQFADCSVFWVLRVKGHSPSHCIVVVCPSTLCICLSLA